MEEKKYKVAFYSLLFFILGTICSGLVFYNMTKENEKYNESKIDDKSLNEKLDKKNDDTSSFIEKVEKENESINKELSKNDNIVIQYLSEKYEEISSSRSKDTAKKIFIEIVDFLFYDGKIKNYTLKELTNKGKLEVINWCTKIEIEIEKKYPGAIDELDTKYKDNKESIMYKYNEYIDTYCRENSKTCDKFRESLSNVESAFKKTFNIVKEYSIEGVDKFKNWYEKFKSNEEE